MSDSPVPETPQDMPKRPSFRRPKKVCWREEYIRILEWLEYPVPLRPHSPVFNDNDVARKVLFQELMGELESAGFVHATRIPSLRSTFDRNITYAGRLELDRLKSLRSWNRLVQKLEGVALFVLGVVFNATFPLVLEFVKARFQK